MMEREECSCEDCNNSGAKRKDKFKEKAEKVKKKKPKENWRNQAKLHEKKERRAVRDYDRD